MFGTRTSLCPPHAAGRLPGASLLLAAAAIILFVLVPMTDILQYERVAISEGQLWRILTGHFTHWSPDHLFWDVLAFTVLGGLCELNDRRRMLSCVVISACAISAVVWTCLDGVSVYRGLSGVDSALFVLAAVIWLQRSIGLRETRRAAALVICLLAFAAKVGLELTTGRSLFVDSEASGMTPVPLAHVIGALVGFIFAITPGLRAALGGITTDPFLSTATA